MWIQICSQSLQHIKKADNSLQSHSVTVHKSPDVLHHVIRQAKPILEKKIWSNAKRTVYVPDVT